MKLTNLFSFSLRSRGREMAIKNGVGVLVLTQREGKCTMTPNKTPNKAATRHHATQVVSHGMQCEFPAHCGQTAAPESLQSLPAAQLAKDWLDHCLPFEVTGT